MMIQSRKLMEVNTDPQRRCYNGCHFSSALIWTAWEDFCDAPDGRVEERLEFWRSLNAYAVSQRGEANTLTEYRVVESKVPA